MAVIETNGLSDRGLYSQVMANLGKAYSQYGVGDGNYPNVDDILTDRALYNIWMRNLLNAKIFIDGMGVTNRTAQAQGVSSVRVPIMAPPPYVPRTITMQPYTGSYLPGTPGNDGLENRNLPNTPQTDGFDVYFNQLYDQPTVIYKLSQNMLSLPIVAQYTGMIPDTVANMEDSTIMATQIKGALYRAATTENANVVDVDLTSTDDGYLQQTMNKVIGLMTNPQTSWAEGIVQYDLDRCVIIMKQAFFDLLFSVKNGVLINGGNLPQEMLLRGAFTEDGRPKGNLIRGMYSGVYIKVVPDSYWRQAAAYMGITADQFAEFDKIQAYIANAEGTAFGRADTTINPIPNPGSGVGTKIQNLWQWGCGVVRPSALGIVISDLENFTNPVDTNGNIVAPADFNEVISSYGTASVNYGKTQKIGVYGSDDVTTVTATIKGTESGTPAITNALLTITSDGKPVGFTNNADGTYTYILGRGKTATVKVTASGYTTQTVNVTSTNTASATYAQAINMVKKS